MGKWLSLAFLTALIAMLSGPLYRQLTLFGVFRERISREQVYAEGQNIFTIEDTMQCEDLHYHASSHKLFTACEDSMLPRYDWFPPMTSFKKPSRATGSIHVIDPETMKSTRLSFEDFSGPFITHGIDVTADPQNQEAVYVFAVNHAPHPAYHPDRRPDQDAHWEGPKAQSQIELFHHVLGSSSVKHVRSIRHPLIRTPNDIYAESPTSFFVTNDHGHRDGLLRVVEDLVPLAKWSDIAHVQLDTTVTDAANAEEGIDATIAMTGLYNNNGLGHGRSADEVLIGSAAGGIVWRAEPILSDNGETKLSILEEIRMDSMLDNPSYFADPSPFKDGTNDASGYVFGGMRKPLEVVVKNMTDPTAEDGAMVWYLRPRSVSNPNGTTTQEWETRLLFEDDGTFVRAASTAVLVPMQGKSKTQGKEAWLFVTGFISKSVVAVKVEL